jgi:hypothetical protein
MKYSLILHLDIDTFATVQTALRWERRQAIRSAREAQVGSYARRGSLSWARSVRQALRSMRSALP